MILDHWNGYLFIGLDGSLILITYDSYFHNWIASNVDLHFDSPIYDSEI